MAHREKPSDRTRHTHAKPPSDRRILILDPDKAKPNSAAWMFLKQQSGRCGRDCIEVIQEPDGGGRITISEKLCAVCLTRAKQCPGGAVRIVRLPGELSSDTTHRYGPNTFKLHGLPTPRPGHVLGLLGSNGTGKSTATNVLAGRLKPNLGLDSWSTDADPPSWRDIVRYYRGSDLQNYFDRLSEDRLRCAVKPQLEQATFLHRLGDKKVGDLLRERDERGKLHEMVDRLQLSHLLDREIKQLSGGELQRFALCATLVRDVDAYLFDEASSFLDVKQRLAAMEAIRSLVDPLAYWTKGKTNQEEARQIVASKYVQVVEHDLTMLDYSCDYICCLYGEPGAYGVVAKRSTAGRAINQYLAGYLTAENVRFRSEELTFNIPEQEQEGTVNVVTADEPKSVAIDFEEPPNKGEYTYTAMSHTFTSGEETSHFTLQVDAGVFRGGEVVGLLGQNGTGKSTFMKMLAGSLEESTGVEDENDDEENTPSKQSLGSLKSLGVSYKRQHLGNRFRKFGGTVQDFLEAHIQSRLGDRMFRLLVMKPLSMDKLEDLPVQSLSGGELQRLAICVCLGRPARVYLIDEPSAGLDCEQRIAVAKVIRRYVTSHLGATAFVIEHDMAMACSLFDRVVLFRGKPGVECRTSEPLPPVDGFNGFLEEVGVTFKRDRSNGRPRVNKRGSRADREQKASGDYYSFDFVSES